MSSSSEAGLGAVCGEIAEARTGASHADRPSQLSPVSALLYQVATGGLSPANIAAPLRAILKRYENIRVLLGEAIDIDVSNRRVVLSDGEVGYNTLIVAAGVRHHYFGRNDWEELAPG